MDDKIIANLAFIRKGESKSTTHTSLFESDGYKDSMSNQELITRWFTKHAEKAKTGSYTSMDNVDRVLFQRGPAIFCRMTSTDITIYNVRAINTPRYVAEQA